MPSAVDQETVTSRSETASRLTVNCAASPSATVKSSMESAGSASSSVIVASPVASARVAFTGLLSVIVKVSFGSSKASFAVGTEMVRLWVPAGMVSDCRVRAM